MAIVTPLLTPYDVERMMKCGEIDPEREFELVNGEIIWMAPSHYPQPVICMLIGAKMVPFAQTIGGLVFDSSGGFMVGDRNQQLRAPDISLVTKERLGMIRQGGFQTASPDLAVEVLSDDQYGRAYQHTKTSEYFAAGSKIVWFVDHRTRTVAVHEAGRPDFTTYPATEEVTLDQIAPGFRCRVSEFFPD